MKFFELLNELNKAGYHDLSSPTHSHLYNSESWCMMIDDCEAGRMTLITANSFIGADTPEEGETTGLIRFLNSSGGDDDMSDAIILFIQVDGIFTHVLDSVDQPYTAVDGVERFEEIVTLYI